MAYRSEGKRPMTDSLWWDEPQNADDLPAGPVPLCTAKRDGRWCGEPAITSVRFDYGHGRLLPTISIRPDHLEKPELTRHQWRCVLCLHHEIDVALRGKIERT